MTFEPYSDTNPIEKSKSKQNLHSLVGQWLQSNDIGHLYEIGYRDDDEEAFIVAKQGVEVSHTHPEDPAIVGLIHHDGVLIINYFPAYEPDFFKNIELMLRYKVLNNGPTDNTT